MQPAWLAEQAVNLSDEHARSARDELGRCIARLIFFIQVMFISWGATFVVIGIPFYVVLKVKRLRNRYIRWDMRVHVYPCGLWFRGVHWPFEHRYQGMYTSATITTQALQLLYLLLLRSPEPAKSSMSAHVWATRARYSFSILLQSLYVVKWGFFVMPAAGSIRCRNWDRYSQLRACFPTLTRTNPNLFFFLLFFFSDNRTQIASECKWDFWPLDYWAESEASCARTHPASLHF